MTLNDSDPSTDQILSMDIFETHDSLYRVLRRGRRIVYVTIGPGILTQDEYDFPPDVIKRLSRYSAWLNSWKTLDVRIDDEGAMRLSEDATTPHSLPHHLVLNHYLYNILSLHTMHRFNHRVSRVRHGEMTAILKIARFPFEMPWLANEVSIYSKLEASDSDPPLAPGLLGLVAEADKRVVGFLCEEIHGEVAGPNDHAACETALQSLHDLGIVHGDLNRYNMIVNANDAGVRFIDFEDSVSSTDRSRMQREMQGLRAALAETSGRGAPFVTVRPSV